MAQARTMDATIGLLFVDVAKSTIIPTDMLGRAMPCGVRDGSSHPVLENAELRKLGAISA